MGEEAEGQQQLVHADGGVHIVEVMLAARDGLGHESQRRLSGAQNSCQR